MKYRLVLLLSIILLLFSCSDEFTGGASEGELLSGTFVTEDKTPVEGAKVRVFREVDQQFVDSTETDSKGYYAFANLKTGLYGIDAKYSISDTLVALINNIQYNGVYDVGEKVMRAPGAISGQVTFDAKDKGGVNCYLEGTSFNAYTDTNGYYTIYDIHPGEYELVLEKSGSLFAKKRYGRVTVISDSLLTIEPVTLEYDTAQAPPAPKDVKATYNPETGIATIEWTPVSVADLAGYVLFGTGRDGVTTKLSNSLITTTSTKDSLWRRVFNSSDKSYAYQLKSQDLNNNLSDLLSEKFTLIPTKGPVIDTTGENDTVDDKGNKAVTDSYIDSLYDVIDTCIDLGQNVTQFKLAFSDKFLNAKQFTTLIELFMIYEEFEEVILFAYPTKMINPDKLYRVLVDDPNRVFLEEDFLNTLIAKPPLFEFDAEADIMSSSSLSSILSAMEQVPMEYEKAGVAKLAIKYEHISQTQLDVLLSAIPEGDDANSLKQYAQDHILQ